MPTDFLDPVQPNDNPYLSLLEDGAAQQNSVFSAHTSLAIDTNPDEMARQKRISALLGRPLAAVQALPEESERTVKIQAIEQATKNAPTLRRAYTEADFAKLAHDDADTLSKIEGSLRTIARSSKAGLHDFVSSGAGLLETGYKLQAESIDDPFAKNMLLAIASKFEDWRKDWAASAELAAGDQSDLGSIEKGINAGFRSMAQMVPGLLTTVLTRSPVAALGFAGVAAGSPSATKALDEGHSPLRAALFGGTDALIEIGTEAIPIARLLKDLRVGAPLYKVIARQIATEVPGELAATTLQNLNEWATLHPDKPFSAYLDELPEDLEQTVIAAITMAVLTGGLGKGVSAIAQRAQEKQSDVARANQTAEQLSELNQLAAADKLLQRNANTFEKFIAQATEDGPVQHIFVDANTLMQSGVADQVAALSPAVAAQLQEALQTGGQIAIPIEEYATRIAPTEHAQALLSHLKTDPEGFSAAEAQAYMQSHAEDLQLEVAAALAGQQSADAYKEATEAVRNTIKAQLDATARFTPQTNAAYATLVSNFYGAQAAKLGVTAQELFQQYPIRISAERILDDQQLEQGQEGPFGPILTGYKGDAQGAIAKLIELQDGEAIGALHHPDIGDIDLVWGEVGTGSSDGYGLSKLAHWHPEVLDDLQGVISSMNVVNRSANRVQLESEDHQGGVRLQWDNSRKHWLLTAFRKDKAKDGSVPRTDTNTKTQVDDSPPTHPSDAIVTQKLEEFYQNRKGDRGSFSPANLTVSLLKDADLSTFLHEVGHFFLHVQFDMAAQLRQKQDANVPGQAQIVQDTDVLLNWFGVESLQAWSGLSFEQQRDHHERFARGFEAYLFEGQAPSIELQGIFQRFRTWLLSIYKDLKALNVELNPAVRGVFDRMLATDEQIALAEQGRRMMPLFTSPEQAQMTPEEFAAYQALNVDATSAAIQEMQAPAVRDTQWLHSATGRIAKQLQEKTEALRADVADSAQQEVLRDPVYLAWQFVTGDGRLDINAIEDMELHGTVVEALKARQMTSDVGLHPDVVAERYGFTSGDELVRKLAAAQPPTAAVAAHTDQRMLEDFAELSTAAAIERAADQAIHNSIRGRFLATEANALAKATGQRSILASAADEYAKALIARVKVRAIRPSQYANAEARAARAAEKANASGDLASAATEKRNQLIQHYATRAAYAAQDDVENGLKYFRKFEGAAKTLDADYADQISKLLERFDLRKSQTNKDVDQRTALAEWLKAQREAGFEPQIPSELENEAFRTSYKNLTVEEFRGLVDTVRQIEHLGRLKHKLLTSADQRTFDEVKEAMGASIHEHGKDRTANARTPTTNMGRKWQAAKRFWYAHIKVATWARILDGGQDGGPMWNYIVRSANKCADRETTMRAEATAKLTEILAPVLKGAKMGGKGRFFASISRSLNRQERFAIALNMGNASNIQRMLGGESWTTQQLSPVLQSLTTQEWQTVQAVWDHLETYWPQIAAKERRVYGREPPRVPPQPFSVVTADGTTLYMRGGYYPVKYDPAASQRAEEHADAEGAKRQLQGAFTTATTRRAFTKARAEQVVGRPLLYTLSGVYSGINDVIHDLAWHEWLIDTNRLLRSHTVDSAIREHYGPEVKQQLKSWVQDIAEGERGADGALGEFVSRMRRSVSVSALGFNLVSAVVQPLGITQSMTRIGAKWVGRGLMRYMAHPVALTREVNSKSEFMANRTRTRFRELNELSNQVRGESTLEQLIARYAYVPMMRCQQMVDVPTWWGAYEKATAEGADDARAIAMADQAVIDAQGGGQLKDLAAIERGGWTKIFTVFYSFANTTLNLSVEKAMAANTPAKKAMLLVEAIRLYIAPTAMVYFLKAALTPGDDDPWEDLSQKLIAEQLTSLMGHMVLLREFRDLPGVLMGDGVRSYTGPTGLRVIQDTYKFATQAEQLEFDAAFWKASINLVGVWYGLPVVQTNRVITGVHALAEGDTENPSALLFGHKKQR